MLVLSIFMNFAFIVFRILNIEYFYGQAKKIFQLYQG